MIIPHSKPFIDRNSVEQISTQVTSRQLARGKSAERFEQELKEYTEAESVHLASSGTAALMLALSAMNVGKDDEVVLPTYVCHSVADAILLLGATPVFCDVGDQWNMTPEAVGAVVTHKTKAIIIVHIFGIYADVKEFRRFGIPLIEDCCQCFGKEVGGNRLGINSDIAFYSFQATKCLTTGEGGAVGCFNGEYSQSLKEAAYKHTSLFPMSDLQASLGLSQLRVYEKMLTRRKEIAEYYFENLAGAITASLRNVSATMYFRFPLRLERDFETVKAKSEASGVAVRKGVDDLLHKRYGYKKQKFPVAERLFSSTVSIPLYPALTDEEMRKVVREIKKIADEN